MADQAKIKLSRLREIGWSYWDPIGLKAISDGDWQDGGSCADEYDGYLIQVAGRLRRGDPPADIIAYLEDIEIGHMGLNRNITTRSRAEATVNAIASYVASLQVGPLKLR